MRCILSACPHALRRQKHYFHPVSDFLIRGHDRDADLYASRVWPLFLSLIYREQVVRHAQRALSEPLQNQAHRFGSVPRECLRHSAVRDDFKPALFPSLVVSTQTGGEP